jgi:ubiquinone/menaquinone biosynthesis C-methylase UbiE
VNCDRIAAWYRWIEFAAFGPALMRRRLAFLRDVADARRILVAGEGDGRFLVRLVEQNPSASIDYVDLSGKMLELARQRARDARVNFVHGDIRSLPLPESTCDLIVTHFLLDCFDEGGMCDVIRRLARAAAPQARWLISEFRQPAAGFARVWAALWLGTMYRFFRLATGLKTARLVDHRPQLAAAGFTLVREERAWMGMIASELWQRGG